MAQVTVRNVRKSYGATEVIHGLNIDIQDGEFVVLVRSIRMWKINASSYGGGA